MDEGGGLTILSTPVTLVLPAYEKNDDSENRSIYFSDWYVYNRLVP